jgi:chloride channel 3/4/5
VILVEQHGRLRGLITIKDILKEIIAQEALEQAHGASYDAELEESLEEVHEWLKDRSGRIAAKLGLGRGGGHHGGDSRVRLESGGTPALLPMSHRSTGSIAASAGGDVVFDAESPVVPDTTDRRGASSRRLGNPFEMR